MKRIYSILVALLLVASLQGQVLRHPFYIATVASGGSTEPPSFLTSDGDTEVWFIADEANFTKDGSDYVSQWDDVSGNDHHMTQGTAANQPLWSADGVEYDEGDATGAYPVSVSQPITIYAVFRTIEYIDYSQLWDLSMEDGQMLLQNSASGLRLHNGGSNYSDVYSYTNNTFYIMRIVYNGASSTFQLNEGSVITWNAGTVDLDNIDLGNSAHTQWKELIVRSALDDASHQGDVYDYLYNVYF